MPLTLAEQEEFLRSDQEKIVLCDIEYHDGTEVKLGTFANYPYIMQYGDSFTWKFSNVVYVPYDLGTDAIVSGTTITYAEGSWSSGELVGKYVYNKTLGKYAEITANTATIITADTNLTAAGWTSNDNIIVDPGTIVEDRSYEDIVMSVPDIIEKIDSDVNFGAIEFLNADGEYDLYINYAWEGRPLKIFIGHPSWPKGDFIPIIEGVSTTITSPRPNVLALTIKDKKEVFNAKAQEQLITHDYIYDLYGMHRNAVISNIVDGVNIRTITVDGADFTNITYAKIAGKTYENDAWLPATYVSTDSFSISVNDLGGEAYTWLIGNEIDYFLSTDYPFTETASNIEEPVIGVEINLGNAYGRNSIARITAAMINSIPEFEAESDNERIKIEHLEFGDVDPPQNYGGDPIYSNNNPGFTYNTYHQTYPGTAFAISVSGDLLTFAGTPLTPDIYNYNADTDEWAMVVNVSIDPQEHAYITSNTNQVITIENDGYSRQLVANWGELDTIELYRPIDHLDGNLSLEIGERSTITIPAGITGQDLNNDFFTLNSYYRKYYFWYNIDYTGEDPGYIIKIPEYFNPTVNTIPDTIINTPVPITLGKCFNIEPKLIDASNHVYQVHEAAIGTSKFENGINEVRANGVELYYDVNGAELNQYEINNNIGCFRLLIHENNTQITADVYGARNRGTGFDQSYSLYKNTAPWLAEWLALSKTSLTKDDICTGTFPIYDESAGYTSPYLFSNFSEMGIYISDEQDIASLITDIMASVGGYARFGRVCAQPGGADKIKFQIFELIEPDIKAATLLDAGYTILNITTDQIKEKGLSLSATETPKHTISIGYRKNWHPQEKGTLAGLLTDPNSDFLYLLDLYTNEYSSVYARNEGIKDLFPLAQDTDIISTFLYNRDEAQVEVDKRIAIRDKKRLIYRLDCNISPLTIGIGDVVRVIHPRFSFYFGKYAIVIGLEENPVENKVSLEVWL